MKVMVYFNYTSCVSRYIEVESEDEIDERIEDLRCEVTDEEILESAQEVSVDYDIQE